MRINKVSRSGAQTVAEWFFGFMMTCVLLAVALEAPARAQAALRLVDFNIAGQALDAALVAFSQQCGIQLVVPADIVRGKSTRGVQGKLEPGVALTRLLEGSGLEYRPVNARSYAIRPAEHTPASTGEGSEPPRAHSAESGTRVAQVDAEINTDASVEREQKAARPDSAQLDEVVVTGSRIPHVQNEDAQPTLIYTSADIARSGQTTVSDFLGTLPSVSVPSVPGSRQTFASQRTVQLHGLPLGTTLVLIDGRRTETSRYGYLDLSSIPAMAIERVEIIPIGSSAIYGSDALAGVVNLVLKKGFNGVETYAKFGAADGTSDTSAGAGIGADWGRGAVSLLANYQKQTNLAISERSRPYNNDYRALGGLDQRVDYCDPGNVYSLTGANLPGLQHTSAAIPIVDGTATLADFQAADTGQVRKCNRYSKESLIPPTEQYSALATAHYEFAPWLDLFANVLYSHFQTVADSGNLIYAYPATSSIVSANNPYNPFHQDVGVAFAYSGSTANTVRTTQFVRPLIGVRGDLGHDWYWELTGLYSYDDFTAWGYARDSSRLAAALASSDPATALNVFSSSSPASQALLDSFASLSSNWYSESLASAQTLIRGPVLELPAGPLHVVLGAEYDGIRQSDQLAGQSSSVRHRDAYAVFSEVRAPLLAVNDAGRVREALTLSAAGRYDESNDFGGKSTFQGGLEWRPFAQLLLRGTYGTSYRAPQLSQIFGADRTGYTTTVTDPLRGNSTYTVGDYRFGSSPDLDPESGHSRSLGFVYSSERIEGFEVSLTHWSAAYRNYIGSVNIQDLLRYPNEYPANLVVRAAATPQDVANGYAGAIQTITSRPVNFGNIEVSGFDFGASYRIPTAVGTFKPSLAVTETYRYDVALRPGVAAQSYVSQATASPGYAPRWKGAVTLDWERNDYSAAMVGRYTGSYNDYTTYGGTLPHDIGNFWLCDVNARWNVGHTFAAKNPYLERSYVSIGAVNVFDKDPKFSYYPTGYDYTQDIRGRFVYLQAGASF